MRLFVISCLLLLAIPVQGTMKISAWVPNYVMMANTTFPVIVKVTDENGNGVPNVPVRTSTYYSIRRTNESGKITYIEFAPFLGVEKTIDCQIVDNQGLSTGVTTTYSVRSADGGYVRTYEGGGVAWQNIACLYNFIPDNWCDGHMVSSKDTAWSTIRIIGALPQQKYSLGGDINFATQNKLSPIPPGYGIELTTKAESENYQTNFSTSRSIVAINTVGITSFQWVPTKDSSATWKQSPPPDRVLVSTVLKVREYTTDGWSMARLGGGTEGDCRTTRRFHMDVPPHFLEQYPDYPDIYCNKFNDGVNPLIENEKMPPPGEGYVPTFSKSVLKVGLPFWEETNSLRIDAYNLAHGKGGGPSECEKNEAWSISGCRYEISYAVGVTPPLYQFYVVSGLEL